MKGRYFQVKSKHSLNVTSSPSETNPLVSVHTDEVGLCSRLSTAVSEGTVTHFHAMGCGKNVTLTRTTLLLESPLSENETERPQRTALGQGLRGSEGSARSAQRGRRETPCRLTGREGGLLGKARGDPDH